jgi:thioredoxin reductase
VAEQLGCTIAEGPNGPYLQTNESKETSVPGVYGCGDAARVMHSVTFAVSDGAMAGISAHRALITW